MVPMVSTLNQVSHVNISRQTEVREIAKRMPKFVGRGSRANSVRGATTRPHLPHFP